MYTLRAVQRCVQLLVTRFLVSRDRGSWFCGQCCYQALFKFCGISALEITHLADSGGFRRDLVDNMDLCRRSVTQFIISSLVSVQVTGETGQ